MPRHTLGTRPLEGEERDQIGPAEITKTDEWGCALGVLALAAVLGCALGVGLQVAVSAVARMRFVPFVTTVLLVALAWRVASAIRKTRRETLTRAVQDRAEDAAQVIEVWDPIAVRQDDVEDAIFFLDIGGGKILIIAGPDLDEIPEKRLGRPWPAGGTDRSRDLWQPPFLNTHFVLHRGRQSGHILRVDVLGAPIDVRRVIPEGTVPLADRRPSAVMDGTLETLLEADHRGKGVES